MAGGQERELRRRIRTVESTQKITRAFELIAASQIVRAQSRIAGARPYVQGMQRVLATTAAEATGATRLLGTPERPASALLLLVVADRGLCGGYNLMALRTAERLISAGEAEGRAYQLVTVGRKGAGYFRFRHREVRRAFTHMTDRPSFADARAVAGEVVPPFLSGEVDLVELVSWRFRSAGSQVLSTEQVLPLPASSAPAAAPAGGGFYDFEPAPEELLELLVPQYAEAVVYQALLEASASEHTARQRAMSAATENAEELIKTLRRVMNRVRQDAVTTEIMEIVGGAEALRHGAREPVAAENDIEERSA